MLVRQFDNIRVVANLSELANERHGPMNALEESAWPHRALDLEVAEVIDDVKKPGLELDPGNVFANINSVAGSPLDIPHVVHSPRSNAERGEGAPTSGECKSVTRINPRLRLGAKLQRRTEAATSDSGIPTPSNDNWPSEAA